jgi:hypothetical protein
MFAGQVPPVVVPTPVPPPVTVPVVPPPEVVVGPPVLDALFAPGSSQNPAEVITSPAQQAAPLPTPANPSLATQGPPELDEVAALAETLLDVPPVPPRLFPTAVPLGVVPEAPLVLTTPFEPDVGPPLVAAVAFDPELCVPEEPFEPVAPMLPLPELLAPWPPEPRLPKPPKPPKPLDDERVAVVFRNTRFQRG